MELGYANSKGGFLTFVNHSYGIKKILVLTVIFVFVFENSDSFHHF